MSDPVALAPATSSPAFPLSRRRLLAVACAGAALGGLLLSPAGQAWAALTPQAEAELAIFMTLSQRLTGRSNLDPRIGQRLYQALAQRDSALGQSLGELQAHLGDAPQRWSERQQWLARQILSGWYLGKIGEGDQPAVVAYETALMFKAVDDVLLPRSYCVSAPALWSAQPVERGV
ncbi:sugar dehydrogenase complex small subunit [Pseudomonas panipatensis]|uniref:Membrane bound FAD containing D-sorbitol dehydrogenase n=1 Tax=Pseudomonas panipatensis TaxID=428992 RepID=A0A1G8J4N7_9PSED|nr:sugar dehydrogenase complex small subunit [Pseudomonas panipatensis]SDI26176.1 Membrane bound FAD containing D-sorbitol dehydrogenase [Pseudomonas panipatensis]SMP49533.1 Membrane bound FAD containing D-sorbitol dehydrogenase [Pseudomonas panipatensis]